MKRKIKYKFWAKVGFTAALLFSTPFIYRTLKYLGENIMTSRLSEVMVIIGWLWLIFGQTMILMYLWEEEK